MPAEKNKTTGARTYWIYRRIFFRFTFPRARALTKGIINIVRDDPAGDTGAWWISHRNDWPGRRRLQTNLEPFGNVSIRNTRRGAWEVAEKKSVFLRSVIIVYTQTRFSKTILHFYGNNSIAWDANGHRALRLDYNSLMGTRISGFSMEEVGKIDRGKSLNIGCPIFRPNGIPYSSFPFRA